MVSIVDFVGSYVSLRKKGKSYTGLCPFHDDKNPSFHVDDEKGMFYCFSCKAGGDVYAFLENIKGYTFKEALSEVAERAGVELEKNTGRISANETLFSMNKAVCGFFRKSLTNGSSEARKALSYLKQRGITSGIAEHFSIGYAPLSGDAIVNFLSDGGFSRKLALQVGLLSGGDDSKGAYGKFRGRVIFPIFTPNSKVAGFGGRILDTGGRAPKYLNSSESVVYRKRNLLYGLNKTGQEIRKSGTAVLVEGYTDLLSAYAAGVKNVAASLGTSLTRNQVSLLRRYADDIVILYDGDRAGMDSSFTAGEIFMANGVVPRVARVPQGLDPDQFARESGSEALHALVQDAASITEVLMDDISDAISEKKVSRPTAAKRLMSVVTILGDSPETGPYVREVSRRFGFRENDLYSMVSSSGKAPSLSNFGSRKDGDCDRPAVSSAEMMLLRIALKFPDMAEFLCGEKVMKNIPDGTVKDIISSIHASGIAGSGGASVRDANELLSQAQFTLDTIDFMDRSNVGVEVEKCLVRLKLDVIGKELKSIRETLRVLESGDTGDSAREQELMKHYGELLERKKLIMEGLS